MTPTKCHQKRPKIHKISKNREIETRRIEKRSWKRISTPLSLKTFRLGEHTFQTRWPRIQPKNFLREKKFYPNFFALEANSKIKTDDKNFRFIQILCYTQRAMVRVATIYFEQTLSRVKVIIRRSFIKQSFAEVLKNCLVEKSGLNNLSLVNLLPSCKMLKTSLFCSNASG